MKKICLLVFSLLILSSPVALSQISISDFNFSYTQNFNGVDFAQTSTLPAGWTFVESGSSANSLFADYAGPATNSGNTYRFLVSGDAAFGGLQSGSVIPTIGVSFQNNSGQTITTIPIAYKVKYYRIAVINRNDGYAFEYSTDATSLTTGTWTNVSELGYVYQRGTLYTANPYIEVHTSSEISHVINLSLTNGSTIWFRWIDINASGSDDAYGIDDFKFNSSATPLPVELTSFTASSVNGTVNLNWATATEVSNYGFEVERSADKSVWNKIGFVAGNGNSNSVKSYSYSDNTASAGTVYYRLKQLDTDGKYEYSKVISVNNTAPDAFSLDQNFPNPFNPSTTIRFSLANSSNVKVDVYASNGELVHTLANQTYEAGNHAINFDASQLSAGIYLYRITAIDAAGKSFSAVKKMQLIK